MRRGEQIRRGEQMGGAVGDARPLTMAWPAWIIRLAAFRSNSAPPKGFRPVRRGLGVHGNGRNFGQAPQEHCCKKAIDAPGSGGEGKNWPKPSRDL
jgi:hypothetical protein